MCLDGSLTLLSLLAKERLLSSVAACLICPLPGATSTPNQSNSMLGELILDDFNGSVVQFPKLSAVAGGVSLSNLRFTEVPPFSALEKVGSPFGLA